MLDEDKTTSIKQLISIYKKQESQYSLLIELLQEQATALQNKDFQKYNLTGEKINIVFGEIDSCLQLINEQKKLLEKGLDIGQAALQNNEEKVLGSLQDLHTKALSINDSNEELLNKYIKDIKDEFHKISVAKQMAEAYRTGYKPTPRFIDNKS